MGLVSPPLLFQSATPMRSFLELSSIISRTRVLGCDSVSRIAGSGPSTVK